LDLKERKMDRGENCTVMSFIACILHLVRVIKSRSMRWAEHVARMGEGRGVYRVLVGRPRQIGIDMTNWIRWLRIESNGMFL
jgi:hypothetical protein